jgi:hypothetical protein
MQPQVKSFIVEKKKKRRRALNQRQTEPTTLMPAMGPPTVPLADRKPGRIGRVA